MRKPTLAQAYARILQGQESDMFYQMVVGLNLNISDTEVGDNVKVEFLEDRSNMFIVDAVKFDDNDEPVPPTYLVLGMTDADKAKELKDCDDFSDDEFEITLSKNGLEYKVQEVEDNSETGARASTIYYFTDGSHLTVMQELFETDEFEQFIVWPK